MTGARRITGVAVAAGLAIVVARASNVRVAAPVRGVRSESSPLATRRDAAVLRLAWRARVERVEDCHRERPEVLEKLPPHMRQAVVCEGMTASYRLRVLRNGTPLLDEVVRGGGLRHDRPLYVAHDVLVQPGDATIRVEFDRIESSHRDDDDDDDDDHATSDGHDEARREKRQDTLRDGGAPATLHLERPFTFAPRAVTLITYDDELRTLVAVQERR